MNERWAHVTTRLRGAPRLDDPELDSPADDPDIAAIAKLASDTDRRIVVVGGEPSLRADLPAVIAALPRPTLRTDGLALVTPAAIRPLRDAGLVAVRVLLHSAQPAAHDWLVGSPGAAKRAVRALTLVASAGLAAEIEAVVTRSTAPVLAQLVELAERLGARAVRLRQLVQRGRVMREPLAVQLGMLAGPLERAQIAATRGRIALTLQDFPASVASIPSIDVEHVVAGDAPARVIG